MREIELKAFCELPANECPREKECKSREICDGYNTCDGIDHYDELVEEYEYGGMRDVRRFTFCEDCPLRFYICPHLILEAE